MDLVVSYPELKSRDVLHMLVLDPDRPPKDVFRGENAVFVVRPHLPIMDAIAEVIQRS